MQFNLARRCLVSFLCLLLAFGLFGFSPNTTSPAFAVDVTFSIPSELQEEIERTAKEYDEAAANVEHIEMLISENTGKIAEIERQLPTQQEKGAEATVALYKMQQDGSTLINLVLGASTFEEFINSIEYINYVQQSKINEISRLKTMQNELNESKAFLDSARSEAATEKNRAAAALKKAQDAREEIQRKAIEEAKAQEAAAAAAAAEAAARKAAADAAESESANGNSDPSEESVAAPTNTAVAGGPSEVNWSADKTSFVEEWTGRIDAYLAGSPLAGQGRTFAIAAWNYGVDPRWSPAISNTESTKGRYCFLPHNAWGWGQISWSSWEEAIDAHVQGLARGYGYTITIANAQKYCPPNWEHWYNFTLSQMNSM